MTDIQRYPLPLKSEVPITAETTALYHAIFNDDFELFDKVVDRAELNFDGFTDPSNHVTPGVDLYALDHPSLFSVLRSRYSTPLHCAVLKGNAYFVHRLLECGARIEAPFESIAPMLRQIDVMIRSSRDTEAFLEEMRRCAIGSESFQVLLRQRELEAQPHAYLIGSSKSLEFIRSALVEAAKSRFDQAWQQATPAPSRARF